MLTSRYAMWLGWGKDLTFFYNDEYAAQTLGAKHPWALGRPATEVWAEIWGAIGSRIDRVLATGEATWDEGLLLFLERNGFPEETYHTFSYSPAPNDDGSVGGLFCVVIEQTDQVIGERRLRLLRDLGALVSTAKTLAEAVRGSDQCLEKNAIDFPFSLTYLADSATGELRLMGRTAIAADHPSAPAVLSRASDAPWPVATKAEIVTLDPSLVWPKSHWEKRAERAVVLPLPNGIFIAGLNPYRPVDDDAKSFAELFAGQLAAGLASAYAYEEEKRRAAELAELDRAKTAFFSNVSHEFRTPLTLMLGPTEDALASPDRALRGADLEVVHRNEQRLLKLVNTLLDFARAEAGRVQAAYEPTDLSALTRDLASAFRSAIERAKLRYEVVVPQLDEPIFVDRDMWEKIVLNLLSNALKFTLAGEIRVTLHATPEAAVLEVTDTGSGIAEHELPRMFERFHRIEDVPARTHEGSGIGLALVRDLVTLHGGDIRVASKLGEGTTFTVTIPRGTAHLPSDRIASPRSLGPMQQTAFLAEALRWLPEPSVSPEPPVSTGPDRARILVADDNADMREYIERLLRAHWNVTTVSDGAEALTMLEHTRFDLVVSDVMMPRVDGFELVKRIHANSQLASTPIILLSARAGDEAVADGLRAGADDYLVKPFSASTLLVRVEAQLAAARARASLRTQMESERERLQAMFEISPSGICLFRGPNLVIEIANPNILEGWGKTKDCIGKSYAEVFPEMQSQPFAALLKNVYDTGIPFVGKAVLARLDRHRTGELVDTYFDFVYAPVRAPDGAVVAVFVHAFDVTELVNERAAAERANRMKDEFLATMSHELRTPLNAILGWASLLRARDYDEKGRAKALETIERNAKSQARLIEDVLDVSRITSGKLRLNLGRVEIAQVIHAAVDVIRPAAEAKGIGIEIQLDNEALAIKGDADRLQQVIWNLLSNAVRFTPAGGLISVDAGRSQSAILIIVKDSGAGIPSEHLTHVFERFRQVDSSTTRHHGGLGLGLAIVRHIVEMHGGVVTAESPGKNQGTTFKIQLPIRAIMEAELGDSDRPQKGERISGTRHIDLSRVHVLIADDDDDSREMVMAALASAGAMVRSADSAKAAFELFRAARPDVLVSDIGMPGEDGYALIRRIRMDDLGAKLPAIALTAYARPEDGALALASGFDRHLAKPVEPEVLTTAIFELAAQARARAS